MPLNDEEMINLLEFPPEALTWSTDRMIEEIIAIAPDLSRTTPDGKNILHFLVDKDPKLLKAILNQPDFCREMINQQDINRMTPLDLLENQEEEPVHGKFQKKYMLLLSGSGFIFPSNISLNQFNINRKIIT